MHDVRIDQLGFLAELQKQLGDDLKTQVKLAMSEKSAERASGDFFDALLVSGSNLTIDPAKWFSAYEKGQITRRQFLGALKVTRELALDAMGADDLAKISTEKPSSPALRITRKKGVELKLVESLRRLGQTLAA